MIRIHINCYVQSHSSPNPYHRDVTLLSITFNSEQVEKEAPAVSLSNHHRNESEKNR